ncbi:hypothetical protein Pla52o_23530 [Novipirellula galeiformis]|uniref:Uncharacterized protein n=1 Tax=Novipirellula galeiformis TaxID=2528004 RepID=A0A5C6CMV3_9BACT|nr:hypothetical protein [Novipirellula galeiformis]TWU24426.1 hypothetical protein Pla52o_23530 [Novipirellula galeiformis]
MEKKYKAQEKLNRRAQRKLDQENGVVPVVVEDEDSQEDSDIDI